MNLQNKHFAEIKAMKKQGNTWSEIYKILKSQGFKSPKGMKLHEANLIKWFDSRNKKSLPKKEVEKITPKVIKVTADPGNSIPENYTDYIWGTLSAVKKQELISKLF